MGRMYNGVLNNLLTWLTIKKSLISLQNKLSTYSPKPMQQHTWPIIYGMLEVSNVERVADYWTNVATSQNHVKFGRLIEKCEIVKIHTCAASIGLWMKVG